MGRMADSLIAGSKKGVSAVVLGVGKKDDIKEYIAKTHEDAEGARGYRKAVIRELASLVRRAYASSSW